MRGEEMVREVDENRREGDVMVGEDKRQEE
jgi:hypothetical protein